MTPGGADDRRDAVRRFDALGDEIWRQYIDLDSQAFGPLAYDLGLGKGSVEPGYLAAMARGHRFVRERLGAPLTEELYRSLVPVSLPVSLPLAPAPTYRANRSWIHVHRDRLEPGIEEVWREHGAFGDEAADVSPSKLRLRFVELGPDTIQARLEAALARYGDESTAATDRRGRILAIARLHQALELLHPTSDGNTRRHALVLYKLLVDAGERPAVLTEINDVYVRTPETWARMIAEGMRRHEAIGDAIAHGDDVEDVMRAFDARGVVGQRGARRLGPSRTCFRDVVFVAFAGDD